MTQSDEKNDKHKPRTNLASSIKSVKFLDQVELVGVEDSCGATATPELGS